MTAPAPALSSGGLVRGGLVRDVEAARFDVEAACVALHNVNEFVTQNQEPTATRGRCTRSRNFGYALAPRRRAHRHWPCPWPPARRGPPRKRDVSCHRASRHVRSSHRSHPCTPTSARPQYTHSTMSHLTHRFEWRGRVRHASRSPRESATPAARAHSLNATLLLCSLENTLRRSAPLSLRGIRILYIRSLPANGKGANAGAAPVLATSMANIGSVLNASNLWAFERHAALGGHQRWCHGVTMRCSVKVSIP